MGSPCSWSRSHSICVFIEPARSLRHSLLGLASSRSCVLAHSLCSQCFACASLSHKCYELDAASRKGMRLGRALIQNRETRSVTENVALVQNITLTHSPFRTLHRVRLVGAASKKSLQDRMPGAAPRQPERRLTGIPYGEFDVIWRSLIKLPRRKLAQLSAC